MPNKRLVQAPLSTAAVEQFREGAVAQYAAICFRQTWEREITEILLITSRDTGRWVIPKGWGMRKMLPHEVAEREAWEEAGVVGHADAKPCGCYTYLKALKKGNVEPVHVQVHMLSVARLDRKFPEEGQRILRWFSPEQASAAVAETELKSLLDQVPRLLRGS